MMPGQEGVNAHQVSKSTRMHTPEAPEESSHLPGSAAIRS